MLFRCFTSCALMVAIAHASAQCEWVQPFGPGAVRLAGEVDAVTAWDSDGSGPESPLVVVGGKFTSSSGMAINRVAAWNGSAWIPIGNGFDDGVSALTSWDADGDGPGTPYLIAGGSFLHSGETEINRIAMWDGTAWQPVGSGPSSSVWALTSWDRDGDGPAAPLLLAGGPFLYMGGIGAPYLASWDGIGWNHVALGTPNQAVRSLKVWDADGTGPAAPELLVVGDFTSISGKTARGIAKRDIAAWTDLGTGFGFPWDCVMYDPDGTGPASPVLCACGNSSTEYRVAQKVGSTWQTLGSSFNGTMYHLETWDPDGQGPGPARLVVCGAFSTNGGAPVSRVAQWDGSAWQAMGTGMLGSPTYVNELWAWTVAQGAPEPGRLLAVGQFAAAGEAIVNGVATWDGMAWSGLGSGLDAAPWVYALESWDADGTGPGGPELFAAGYITSIGSASTNAVGRWNGTIWQPLGTGLSYIARALTVWDPDGAGPARKELIVAGEFSATNDGLSARLVAGWNGDSWHSLSSLLSGNVYSLTVWNESLFAGGTINFKNNSNVQVRYAARWDGSDWQPLGSGVNGYVFALVPWDSDGNGPQPEILLATGTFTNAGGVPAQHIAAWNGATWTALGEGLDDSVNCAVSWDEDSPNGPSRQLIVGGSFATAGGVVANHIARWDGAMWHALGAGTDAKVRSLKVWDPDRDGPLLPQLFVGGDFALAGGATANSVARWDGSEWHALTPGAHGGVSSFAEWDLDAEGPLPPVLVVGGTSPGLADIGQGSLAALTAPPTVVTEQPIGSTACRGGSVVLSVATSDSAALYQWQVETHPGSGIFGNVSDGPTGSGASLSGSATPSMLISDVTLADARVYRCVVAGACSKERSDPARITICVADYDCDGTLTGEDFDAFVNAFFYGVAGADVNGDTFVNGDDFDVFAEQYASGCG